jgi:hypothetical protein
MKYKISVRCDRGHTEDFPLQPPAGHRAILLPTRDLAEFLSAFFSRGKCGVCSSACKARIVEVDEESSPATSLAYN